WRRAMPTVVVDIGDDPDDLAPRAVGAFANSLAHRGWRLAPQLARQVLGDDSDRTAMVEVVPREVTARDETGADGLEVARRNVSEPPHGGLALIGHGHIFAIDRRAASFIGHRNVAGKRRVGHARNRRESIEHRTL